MSKVPDYQFYFQMSLYWYGVAEKHKESASYTTNKHVQYELLKDSERAARKAESLEQRAREEIKNDYRDISSL